MGADNCPTHFMCTRCIPKSEGGVTWYWSVCEKNGGGGDEPRTGATVWDCLGDAKGDAAGAAAETALAPGAGTGCDILPASDVHTASLCSKL